YPYTFFDITHNNIISSLHHHNIQFLAPSLLFPPASLAPFERSFIRPLPEFPIYRASFNQIHSQSGSNIMTKVSLEVESGTKPRNPYGPAHGTGASKSNAKLYFVLCLAFLAFAGMGKFFSVTSTKSKDPWADKGDAAGGWGSAHNHRIVDRSSANMDGRPTQQQPNVMNDEQGTAQSVPSYDHDYEYEYDYDGDDGDGDGDQSENLVKPVHEASYYHESMKNHKGKYSGYEPDQELRQADFYGEIWDLISIPTAPRPEYSDYQKLDGDFALAERLLFDMNTPHGKAFDFILNRDKRKISADDPHLIQRFVLALLFYATGGTDVDDPREFASGSSRSGNGGWDSEMAHFLTGLHECHWVKKSMNDQFWGILNMEGDTDKRVGVTKCNVDMEVTEIRLADLNMVGFIPEEIKYLSSLESLDVQNNHLVRLLSHYTDFQK
ncbi:hypothetical protein ACHAXS_007249, partial [Conticribra weissflogii]